MEDIKKQALEQGYVSTIYGRRRYIPELQSPKYQIREFGKRAAMNAPIQGTAADVMKIAMIKVAKRLEKEKLKSKMILQIHDEILIDTRKEEEEKIRKILKEEMESVGDLTVELKVNIEEGDSWYF